MGKLDKTKENIKLNKLGISDRKELYDKFVDAGGKIIDDQGDIRQIKKRTAYDRDKQLAYKKLIESKKQKAGMRQTYGSSGQGALKGKSGPAQQDILQGFLQRLNIRLRLFLLKATDFSVVYFNNKFLNAYNTDYIPSILRLQSLFYELFKLDPNTGSKIKNELLEINSIYFDLIENTSNLYNLKELMPVVQNYLKSPEARYRVTDVKEPLMKLFKKLYILRTYRENILMAFERSILVHMGITSGKSSYYSSKRKVMKADLISIFDKLYPSLYWMFCKFQGKVIRSGSPLIEEILGITIADKPGYRKRTQSSSSADAQGEGESKDQADEKKSEEKKQEEAISVDIQNGLKMLNHFDLKNIKKLRAAFDESKKFVKINDNDKILMIYLIFQEFDKEYSFILTTTKVKYTLDHTRKGSIDYKEKFLISSNDIKKCLSSFLDYTESTEVYFNAKNEKPLSNEQYIEYNKKLGNLLNKRTQAATNVRMTLISFMDTISKLLKSLVEDMKGEKKIIENPTDVISFDISVESNRKLNNKTIYQALSYAYFFTCGFVYRMSSNGDLSGELEFNVAKEGEGFNNSIETAEHEKPAVSETGKAAETPQVDTPEKRDGEKSIEDDLNDFI